MAEGAEENLSARYVCHRCGVEIHPILPDYVCPQCGSRFIEELALRSLVPNEDTNEAYNPITETTDLRNVLHNVLNFDDQSFIHYNQDNRDGRNVSRPGPTRNARVNRTQTRSGIYGSMGARAGGFLEHLVPILLESAGLITNVNVPVFFNIHSNPGDFVLGNDGFDAVLTQLLNGLNLTGPPPLPKEKINEIPSVDICQEQVDKNLQCTVCMENFKFSEPVKKLSCDHHFHDECIVPWLELHGTCPICRKFQDDNSEETSSATSDVSTINQESSLTTSISEIEDLSTVPRDFSSHEPPAYDFADDLD